MIFTAYDMWPALSGFAVLSLIVASLLAPVPESKPRTPSSLVGEYDVTWGIHRWKAYLSKDGRYHSDSNFYTDSKGIVREIIYRGTWSVQSLELNDGTFQVAPCLVIDAVNNENWHWQNEFRISKRWDNGDVECWDENGADFILKRR